MASELPLTRKAAILPEEADLLRPPRLSRWFGEEQPIGAVVQFLLPALLFYAVFTTYPVVLTVWDSIFTVLPNRPTRFVGLANYATVLFQDDTFWHAVHNTLIWAVFGPAMEITLALLLALALYAGIPGSRIFRLLWFTPVLMSYVVVGVIWMWIYNYDWGVIDTLLRLVGLGSLARAWLGDPAVALPALIVVTTWMWTGFNMIVLLAAFHSLPGEVIEAAELDHCSWLQKLWFIMIPLLRPTIVNLFILSFVGKMKVFDLVWVTTRGGPLWATETVSTYVYKRAFDWSTFDLGYPSAIACIWFVIVLACVTVLSVIFRQRRKLEF
jgi:raffinose/stachyose/melibiose transport system permease protein